MSELRREVIADLTALRREFGQRMGAILQKLNGAPPAETKESVPFRGRPMKAKHKGYCPVCEQEIKMEDDIVYNDELRRAAHLGCGQPILRRGGK